MVSRRSIDVVLIGLIAACGGQKIRTAHTDAATGPALTAIPATRQASPCLSFGACTSECEERVAESCRRLSDWYRNGWGIQQDDMHANMLLDQACELGDPLGCPAFHQFGMRQDLVERRVTLLEAGCELGMGDACSDLGTTLWLRGGNPPSADELRRDQALWEKGCDLGSPSGCRRIPHDARTATAERAACNAGFARECEALGDAARTEALFVAECKAGYPPSCQAAIVYVSDELRPEILQRWKKLLGSD